MKGPLEKGRGVGVRVGGAMVGAEVGVASWVAVANTVGVSVGGSVAVISRVGVRAGALMERIAEKPTITPITATPIAIRMNSDMVHRISFSLVSALNILFI